MRHLIGLLSVDTQFLYGIRNYRIMFVISNFGFALTETQIGFPKEKAQNMGLSKKPLLV